MVRSPGSPRPGEPVSLSSPATIRPASTRIRPRPIRIRATAPSPADGGELSHSALALAHALDRQIALRAAAVADGREQIPRALILAISGIEVAVPAEVQRRLEMLARVPERWLRRLHPDVDLRLLPASGGILVQPPDVDRRIGRRAIRRRRGAVGRPRGGRR